MAKTTEWILPEDNQPDTDDDNSILAQFFNGSIETIHISDFDWLVTRTDGNELVCWQELPEPMKFN